MENLPDRHLEELSSRRAVREGSAVRIDDDLFDNRRCRGFWRFLLPLCGECMVVLYSVFIARMVFRTFPTQKIVTAPLRCVQNGNAFALRILFCLDGGTVGEASAVGVVSDEFVVVLVIDIKIIEDGLGIACIDMRFVRATVLLETEIRELVVVLRRRIGSRRRIARENRISCDLKILILRLLFFDR